MAKIDKPWGYEEQILASQVDIGDRTGMLGMRHLVIDTDEMTSYSYHDHQQDVLYPVDGSIVLRNEDGMENISEGESRIIRAGEKHQIQNISDTPVKVLEISFPYRPDDINRVEDPYSMERAENEG